MLGKEEIFSCSIFQLFISIGFLLFSISIAQIPLGSKLSVVSNDYWASSNGNFAVGFFNRSDQYSVGVRFNSNSNPISKQMVVWVAGADLTVGNNSYFHLTQNGELVLFDSNTGFISWTSKTANSTVAAAGLLDTGNFVLFNKKREIVWQSFDTPTDTLLPSQTLFAFQTLRASSRNSLSSYYSLHIKDRLQLRWENLVYWTSKSTSQSVLQAIFSSDGTLHLLDQRSEVVSSVFGEDHGDSDVKFRFLRLDADGNLRMYSWSNISKTWNPVWQAVENQCDVFATCGLSGVCNFNSSGFPVCKCPFTLTTTESSFKCLVPYGNGCKSGYFITKYEHTFLYGIYPPNETITQASLQKCRSFCQEDPLCTAVTFTNDVTPQCRIMKTQYVTGQSKPSLSSISFVKSCSDPIAALPISPASLPSSAHGFCIPCLIGVAVGTLMVFLVIQFGIGFSIYKKRNYMRRKSALAYTGTSSKGLVTFSLSEIKEITANFKHQIGPNMFKGLLPDSQPVAVKDIKEVDIDGRKLRNTVLKIGSIYHKNLLQLEGYCCDSNHRFLVYEFAKNGSLGKYIEDPKLCKRLTWGKRMDICLSVARAIAYLHTGCREFLSHGNLKCENVVLDKNFNAMVSEFGLGREGVGGERDVRDFGKMVVELVSGRREGDDGVCKWAYEMWAKGEAEMVVDGRIEGGSNSEQLERALRIAFWCLQFDEQMRPSMGEVTKVLEGTLTVDPPPPPFVSRRQLEIEQSSESELEP